jgi:hypothetical protein
VPRPALGRLVRAFLLAVVVALTAIGSRADAAQQQGWGTKTGFLGRYHVRPASFSTGHRRSASAAVTQSAIFAPVVAATEAVVAATARPTGGELTLFMRIAKPGKPPVPSGILDLHAPGEDRVLYLTELLSSGTARRAAINGGAFVGPVIGSFSGTSSAAGKLSGLISAEGIGGLSVRLTRFSAAAQP